MRDWDNPGRKPRRCAAALLLLAALAAPARAQAPPAPPFRPNAPAAQPSAPDRLVQVSLAADYAGTGRPVKGDLHWRIFAVRGNDLVPHAESTDLQPRLQLPPGDYIVHVGHGLAAAARRISVNVGTLSERLTLNAGGLILRGKLAEAPIPAQRQSLSVYISAPNDAENKLVTRTLIPGQLIRLPEGPYHIVSTYAGSNSVVRADIIVQSGKVTEATINHRAASVTLKLVRQAGGVALANTAWIVQTPGGDIIGEALGAFPTMELAEGEYDVVARNDGREFKDKVKVVSGVNRDHEVVMR